VLRFQVSFRTSTRDAALFLIPTAVILTIGDYATMWITSGWATISLRLQRRFRQARLGKAAATSPHATSTGLTVVPETQQGNPVQMSR
jgi:hypothetical protein